MTGVRAMTALVFLLLAALTACGPARTGGDPRGPSRAVGPDAEPPRSVTFEAPVTAVRAPEVGRLLLTVEVPAGGEDCARRPRARVESQDRSTVWVQTVVDSLMSVDTSVCGQRTSRDVRLDVRLRGRQLVVNHEAWKPGGGASYARCDETLGCRPPADHCDRVWVEALLASSEIAPERRFETLACDGRWLAVDIDAVMTGCQSLDGSTPPPDCAGKGTHTRWFARWSDAGWDVVASGTGPGCGDVQAAERAFPTRLCAGLPARQSSTGR